MEKGNYEYRDSHVQYELSDLQFRKEQEGIDKFQILMFTRT